MSESHVLASRALVSVCQGTLPAAARRGPRVLAGKTPATPVPKALPALPTAGIPRRWKRTATRCGKAALLSALASAAIVGRAWATPVTVDVDCAGAKNPVGTIAVDTTARGGISGGFTSSTGKPASLAAAAKACGEDHFDWYQVVTSDNGKAKDAKGNFLKAPYVDPPPGGYQGQWDDNLPWYWAETLAPGQKVTELSTKTTADTLKFSDTPSSAGNIEFKTWLVSLNADSSFHSWHEGFGWTYTTGKGVTSIAALGKSVFPTDAEYKNLVGNFDTKVETRKVPEPDTALVLGVGLLGLAAMFRRKGGIVGCGGQ